MKTLGLIGGISWFSTAVYYQKINQLVNERLGGSHAAKLLLYSVNFHDLRVLQDNHEWDKVKEMISDIAVRLQNAGADCILICSNTPHMIAGGVRKEINIPLIHIVEETAKEITSQEIRKVGLLGTKFTMENAFFKDCLNRHGIDVIIPDEADRDFLHDSIFNELTKGIFKDETKKGFQEMIATMEKQGARGVIFGCTEISLLLNPSDSILKVFDTTIIHTRAAADFALSTA
jgi:aspartate racemase